MPSSPAPGVPAAGARGGKPAMAAGGSSSAWHFFSTFSPTTREIICRQKRSGTAGWHGVGTGWQCRHACVRCHVGQPPQLGSTMHCKQAHPPKPVQQPAPSFQHPPAVWHGPLSARANFITFSINQCNEDKGTHLQRVSEL